MKKPFTFALAAALSIGFAIANSSKPVTISTPPSKSTPVSLAALSQVASENQQLREALVVLEIESAELKSYLAYQQTMATVMTSLNKKQQDDMIEEANATISYITTMNNLMVSLQSASNQEQQEELKAQLDYQKTMTALMARLKMTSNK
jgi:hypothetical protein